uniref:Uncharacterized protein n=1 Tax=Arundo donax TaxID=35708 RepID=A0A0A9DCX2_ARUDO
MKLAISPKEIPLALNKSQHRFKTNIKNTSLIVFKCPKIDRFTMRLDSRGITLCPHSNIF